MIYINIIYIKNTGTPDEKKAYVALLAIGVLYPQYYNLARIFKQGLEYFSQPSNYLDLFFVNLSTINCILQFTLHPRTLTCKIIMILIIFLGLLRTFTFLKIVASLSPIVTMLTNVVFDLRIFLFFYLILTVLFSLLLGIIGLGNRDIEGPFQDLYNKKVCQGLCDNPLDFECSVTRADSNYDTLCGDPLGTERVLYLAGIETCKSDCESAAEEYPGIEYKVVGLFIGNIIQTLRMSLGDFGFDAAMELAPQENYIYWVVWSLILLVTCIIFLNFIIAEASASYEKVSEFLQLYILAEKAALIQ